MAEPGAPILIVAALCGALAIGPAVAESVPLPTPAPLPKTGAASAPRAAASTAPAPPSAAAAPAPRDNAAAPASKPAPAAPDSADADAAKNKSFFPFSLPFGLGGQKTQASAFDAKQRALLDRISLYLSSVQTMVGKFVQIGPDGGRTEGTFYIQKPGKVRFQYNPPTPIDIIADGSSVVVRDRNLATQDLYPLSQTPLRYLLADRIDLMRDTNVVNVSADDTFVTVIIEETELVAGTSRLMMMFDAKDLQLKQWTVTDPQGLDTTVAVFNLDSSKKPDPNLFVINYQHSPGISNQ
jgi:outer membrane lipoprotein-sorting protein